MNYYNEFDPGAAAWLRQLIAEGLVPAGEVDERSIAEVQPDDLRGFTQCHFFAGIGGWSYALQLAGVPSSRPIWTGSCPCQPYSVAGKQEADADDRNLWPEFYRLIAECRPITVFGEQVENAIKHGWLDRVQTDLEAKGYAVGAVVLGAHSVGAPHIRQRLFWVADGNSERPQPIPRPRDENEQCDVKPCGRVGDAPGARPLPRAYSGLLCGEESRRAWDGEFKRPGRDFSGLSDPESQRYEWRENAAGKDGRSWTQSDGGVWGNNWIACADGKARRLESGISALAHGVPARVVRLRGYGNAINPQIAAEFIRAAL